MLNLYNKNSRDSFKSSKGSSMIGQHRKALNLSLLLKWVAMI
ncbi:hypothetical protein CUS_4760 [Ruminococcus albus 8]|uniref:Uncharacterized protein n=1 Tax=Ruminococcus albus 8 TaxID=246199 RepID=E9S8D4_RUMAL|nr:hypothetical protein CUS_4760 [Ruminococcus albus 8]